MPNSPWTITSSKRKPQTRASTSRKRTKREHDAAPTNQHPGALKPQQTLTQIAFVTSSSFEDDDPLLDIEPLPTDLPQPATERPARILKRNSTLTQMDFATSFGASGDRRGSSMRPPAPRPRRKPKKRDSTLTQMDFFHGGMDGTAEFDDTMLPNTEHQFQDPQITAPNHLSTEQAPATPIRDHALVNIRTPETQEYQPGNRKRKQDGTRQESGKRRRSSRIAAATSPATDTTFLQPDTIVAPPSTRRRTPAAVPRRPLLEIQDSTEFLEEPVDYGPLPRPANVVPFTPIKNSDRIPSSQTPESIQRSATKRSFSPSKASPRRPLAELSTNLRTSNRKTAYSKARATDRSRKNTAAKSPPRKICVLKVPKNVLAAVERGVRVEELEHDIYSLQATSPPVERGHSSQDYDSDLPNPTKGESDSGGGPTIKETASSQRKMESQESLPDIRDVLDMPPSVANEATEEPVANPATPVRSSGLPMVQKGAVHAPLGGQDQILSDHEPLNMIPELEQISTDELSDLGSPMANDTQFIRSLHERLSSPLPSSNVGPKSNRAVTVPRTRIRSPNFIRGLPRIGLSGSSPRKSPLPAPKLVSTSPAKKAFQQTSESSSLRAMPSFSTQNRSLENVQISFVPLNDTVEYQQSSSSPRLPPAPLSSTQKSTQLASIPRPSQISTQAPSQGYFPPSSAPQVLAFPHDCEIERITVKDSSSFPARLSQIVQHVDDESELEGSLDLFDKSHDEDDLDLDPFTFPLSPTRIKSDTIQTSRLDEEDVTQTPTQRSRRFKAVPQTHSSSQSSPIITSATTRSQRNAKLEVVALISSSSPSRPQLPKDDITPKPQQRTPHKPTSSRQKDEQKFKNDISNSPPSSSISSSLCSPSPPRDLKRKYSPIEGFDNDTQSDYTQNGSVTAAYVHRMWERGDLPRSFVPKPYKLKNFKPSMRSGRKSKG